MNFDFLKGLKGLDTVYKPCTNAEELVKSKPDLSMVAARKSAELIAKFVYMAAHASALENQTFADILADYQVRQFINDRHVMDAFHYIRKNGNTAVHGDQEPDPEVALSVLQNLHYVAGETAKDLDLISSYPDFDENIIGNPNAAFDENVQIAEKAMQMFIEYVQQHERDKHGRLVTFDFRNPAHRAYVLHGRVEMHERIVFDHQPYYQSTLEYLQRYVSFLNDMAYERSDYDDLCTPGSFKTSIILDGELVYTGDNGGNLQTVLYDRLPNAKTFEIDCYVYANMRSFYANPDPDAVTDAINEDDMWQGRGMADQLEALKRKEKFIYKAKFWYPDDDSHTEFAYIRNGKSYDVEDICSADIVQQASKCKFYGDMITMYAAFDFKSHPEIVQQLRQAVLNYVSEDDHPYLEELWEENEEYDDCGYLLSGSCIPDADLSLSQQFADKINQILAPIADQCTIYMNYFVWSSKQDKPDPTMPALNHCFYDDDNFAVASFVWEDNKLQLVGKIL